MKLIIGILSAVAFVMWAIISTIRSIQERPYGPAADAESEIDSDDEHSSSRRIEYGADLDR